MLIKLTNTINSIVRRGLSVIRNGLKMWLPFSKSEILGEELVVNGDFATGSLSPWSASESGTGSVTVVATTVGYGVRIQNTVADGSVANLNLANTLTSGVSYEVTYRIVENNQGHIYLYDSIPSADLPQTVGTHTVQFTATSTTQTLIFNRVGNEVVDITITDISLKEVTQIAPDKSGVDNEILGEEEVTNGDFATDGTVDSTSYGLGFRITSSQTTGSILSNQFTVNNPSDATGTFGRFWITDGSSSINTLVLGKTYKVSYTVDSSSGLSGGSDFLYHNGASYQVIPYSNGTHTFTFTTSGEYLQFKLIPVDSNIVFSNISVKEVTQAFAEPNSAKLFTGKALSFDGVNDYVDFGSDVNSDGTVWTTAIWIGDYTRGNYDWLCGGETKKNIGLNKGSSLTGNVFYRSSDGTYNEFSCEVFKSDFTNAKRLVFTSDGTDISLYIDGEFIDSVTPTTTYLKLSRLMAGYSDATQYLVAATVSDFQLYDVAWTQDDVTFDYNNPQHLVTDNSELRYGSEEVDNGDFELGDNGDWDFVGASWSIENGKASYNGVSNGHSIYQDVSLEIGRTYKVTLDILDNSGKFRVSVDGGTASYVNYTSGDGTYTFEFTASSDIFYIRASMGYGSDTISVDNISVKEIVSPTLNNLKGYWHLSEGDGSIVYDSSGEGNDGTSYDGNADDHDGDGTIIGATWEDQQATIPQLGLMDWSKGSNLIEYSEKMSEYDSGVTVVDNSTTNPNGVTNASKITKSGASANDRIDITNTTLVNGDVYNISAFIKNDDVNGKTTLGVRIASGTLFRQGYEWDGSTLSLSSTFASGTRTNVLLEDIGNGWWKIGYSFTSDGTNSDIEIDLDRTYQSDTTSLFLWGIQLNEGSSATAYRRTNGTAVTDATLIADPNNPSDDILGNSVRLREHSLNLDGSGYAEVADADNLDFGTGDFTLEAWSKGKYVSRGSSINAIFSLGGQVSASDSAALVTSQDNKFGFYCGASAIFANDAYTEGSWDYIAATRTSGVMKIYIDAVLQTSQGNNSNSISTTLSKMIGADTNSARNYADLVDDVRIYDRALSSDEVEQNHKAGLNKHKASSSFSDDFSSDYGF